MKVNIALLTVTDTRTLKTDKSGNILVKADFREQGAILGIMPNVKLPKYSPFHEPFMEYHRKNIFGAK